MKGKNLPGVSGSLVSAAIPPYLVVAQLELQVKSIYGDDAIEKIEKSLWSPFEYDPTKLEACETC